MLAPFVVAVKLIVEPDAAALTTDDVLIAVAMDAAKELVVLVWP